jgi:hypothetical protein
MSKRFLVWVLSSVVFLILEVAWGGYVLQTLWYWFVVPTLHLPALPYWSAAGIMLILRLPKPVLLRPVDRKRKLEEQLLRKRFAEDAELLDGAAHTLVKALRLSCGEALIHPALVLLIGYLLKLAM